ncbi:hypothetical protein O181_062464 [Austropuccinia psidii MF-1]|uniref:Uncharacterized protein n=1 Tax=Austropuccinia psidii MF-1 TaxID=1389203 RepID=A0A9Q3EK61_9BASI|nr:hypothetical protein [Austropuccinia psidii MF-1]
MTFNSFEQQSTRPKKASRHLLEQLKLTTPAPPTYKKLLEKVSPGKKLPQDPMGKGEANQNYRRSKSKPPLSITPCNKASNTKPSKKPGSTPDPKCATLPMQGKDLPPDFKGVKTMEEFNSIVKQMSKPLQANSCSLSNWAEAKRHPNKKCSDKQFNELYQDEVLKFFELSDEEDFADEGEDDEENNDSIDLEEPSDGDEGEEEGFFAPGEYQYKDDEYCPGEESSKEDDESDSDVSSVGNTQNCLMEVVED